MKEGKIAVLVYAIVVAVVVAVCTLPNAIEPFKAAFWLFLAMSNMYMAAVTSASIRRLWMCGLLMTVYMFISKMGTVHDLGEILVYEVFAMGLYFVAEHIADFKFDEND